VVSGSGIYTVKGSSRWVLALCRPFNPLPFEAPLVSDGFAPVSGVSSPPIFMADLPTPREPNASGLPPHRAAGKKVLTADEISEVSMETFLLAISQYAEELFPDDDERARQLIERIVEEFDNAFNLVGTSSSGKEN